MENLYSGKFLKKTLFSLFTLAGNWFTWTQTAVISSGAAQISFQLLILDWTACSLHQQPRPGERGRVNAEFLSLSFPILTLQLCCHCNSCPLERPLKSDLPHATPTMASFPGKGSKNREITLWGSFFTSVNSSLKTSCFCLSSSGFG